MPEQLPPELTGLSDAEKEERRLELINESRETLAELEAEQEALLDSLEDEHGGDLIRSKVTLPGDNLATVECILNGELMDRMGHVDAILAELEDPKPGDMAKVGQSMDEAASLMSDITVEAKYSKEVFYGIYQTYGIEALGEHIEAAFSAIETEVKRRQGAAKGFRER